MITLSNAELAALARDAGVTPGQASAVLAGAQLLESQRAGAVADSPPAASSVGASRAQLLFDGAAWASAAVTLGAVAVFLAFTDAFAPTPDGKVGVLVTGLVFSAIGAALATVAKRQDYVLGVQLAWSCVVILSPLVAWSLAWLLGIWPAQQEWDTAFSAAVLTLSLVPIMAGAYVVSRTHAALSFAVAVVAGHVAFVALWQLVGLPDLSPGGAWVAALVYLGAAGALAAWLEPRERALATWIHPLVCIGAVAVVASTNRWLSDDAALAVALVLIGVGAALAVVLQRMIYLAATAWAAISWDVWLYDVLDLPPVAGLVLTLTLGLGGILLALAIWRRRQRTANGHSRAAAPAHSGLPPQNDVGPHDGGPTQQTDRRPRAPTRS